MLDTIARTKKLILIPPKKTLKYFLILYCKNLLSDCCVKACREAFYVFVYWNEL